jgi:hypothetical protein|tara:strand:+ start:222 stop:1160 length:939 start_codon:yes stop_codon:yes gene_type:complete
MSNILQDLFSRKLSYEDCGHESFIVEIGPELAQKLLALNFAQNRKLSKEYVTRLSTDMKNGEWGLSNDAIVISNDLQVGNAQHRLNAVIQSKTSQKFIVLFGSPKEAFQKFDTGKKRTMEQRITIAGTEISPKECCIIRHAMNDYANAQVGTEQFAYSRHDDLVATVYLKHKEFLDLINARKSSGSSFFHAAALKLYAEMIHYGDHFERKHGHDALTRAQLFIDLVVDGYSKSGVPVTDSEVAALKLRNTIARKKEDKRGRYWNEKNDLRVTITAAYKFMIGQKIENIVPWKSDPFMPFMNLPTTNSPGYGS